MTVRKHFVFKGRVQGVGFRYRAEHAAQTYRLTGYVKNCWDGSVEMELEGDEAAMDEVLKVLNRGTFIDIEAVEIRSIPLEDDGYFRRI